jgi:hypothetical protein
MGVKKSMSEVYSSHCIPSYMTDVQAGVPDGTISNMLHGVPVPRANAEQVLNEYNKQYRQNYSLDTVDVLVKEEDDA